jgi:flavin reductase (DIM6/NTAB) family NADH-FMN oxidoreductase RutF
VNFDIKKLPKASIYNLMTQVIIPRPIAWVLSENENGTHNLAPFSFFNGVSSEPPVISISIGSKRDGTPKDTFENILNRTHFTIHIPGKNDLLPMVGSSKPFDRNVSEVSELNLNLDKAKNGLTFDGHENYVVLENQPISLFARYYKHIEIGAQNFLFGEIEYVHIDDSILEGERISWSKFNPLCRLGYSDYSVVDSSFEQGRL